VNASALFGSVVAVSANGEVLASARQMRTVMRAMRLSSGAVDALVRKLGEVWSALDNAAPTQHCIKANLAGPGDLFGGAVSLCAYGQTLVFGANGKGGNDTHIDSDNNPSDNSVFDSAAVYLY
jgi:hypothetical protein